MAKMSELYETLKQTQELVKNDGLSFLEERDLIRALDSILGLMTDVG